MTWPPNKLVNSGRHPVWCVYSVKDPNGGKWDLWRNRILHPGYTSAWDVDIDYIIGKPDKVTINGRDGWWKLGQGGSFLIADDERNDKALILVGKAIGKAVRYYSDWARAGGDSKAEIAAQIAEWESVRDYAAPIKKN